MPASWQFEPRAGNEDEQADAGQVKPMLGDCRVKCEQIRNWQERENEPPRAKSSDRLRVSFSKRSVAKDHGGDDAVKEKRAAPAVR